MVKATTLAVISLFIAVVSILLSYKLFRRKHYQEDKNRVLEWCRRVRYLVKLYFDELFATSRPDEDLV